MFWVVSAKHVRRVLLAGFLVGSLSLVTHAGDPIAVDDLQRKEPVSFEDEILPILKQNCLACHSAGEKQGGLVLESPQGILQGGDSGAAAVPGRGNESLMLLVASHQEDPVMPPEDNDVAAKNLTPAELGLLKLWIDQGAKGSSGFDTLSPKQWQPLPPGVHPVQAIALTDDGQFIACSRANQIFLYHVPTGQLVTKLADDSLDTQQTTGIAHRDLVQSLAFNLDGDLLASGGFREVKLWRRPRDVTRFNLQLAGAGTAATISPDQNWIAVASADHTIRLFSTRDGQPGATFTGHSDTITSLRFTGDSARLISGSLDRSIRVWILADATQQLLINAPASVNAIELVNVAEPSEQDPMPAQWVVSGDTEKTICVWELPAESPAESPTQAPDLIASLTQITAHSQAVTSLAADPERARHVYSGSSDGSVRRWNLDNGQSVQQINHGAPVTAIAISPEGDRIAVAGDNARAKLYRTNGQTIAEMRGDVRLQVAQTRAQQQLSSANARLSVAKRLLDEAEQDVPKKTEAEKKLADSLAEANKEFAEKQQAVDKAMADKIAAEKAAIEASAAAKNALADQEQAEQLARDAATAMQVAQGKMTRLQQALSANPDNESLQQLLATAEQELSTCQQQAQESSAAVKGPTEKAREMANAANTAAQAVNDVQKPYTDAATELKTAEAKQNLLSQQHALAAKELNQAQELVPDRSASLERAEQAKVEAEAGVATAGEATKLSEQPIRAIAFSADGSLIATAGDFPNVHTWDGQTGGAIAALAGHQAPIRQLSFVGDHSILSVSDDQTGRVWEINPEWTLERTVGAQDDPGIITHRATSVDFNRDASQLLVAGGVPSRSGELHVFRVADGARLLYLPRAHDDVVYCARFSPDGKRIASAGADKYLRTFDVATSTQLRKFEGHTDYVLGVSWKSDGESLASSSADNTIKLWEAETADQRRTINQQLTKHMTAIQFIGETDDVISSSGDRRVRIHRGSNGGIIRTFNEVPSWLHCVAVTPDSKIVAAGDASGAVTVWNGTNGQQLHRFEITSPSDVVAE